jgi:hypothetical protein
MSIAHLKSNGQVKRTNVEILKGLKSSTYDCLKKHGVKWIDELPCSLWANWTSSSWATGETSFFLVYGAEAVISPEVTMVSPHVQAYDESVQDQLLHDDADLVDKTRWQAAHRNAQYC